MADFANGTTSEDLAAQHRERFIRDLILLEFGREVVELDQLRGGINAFVYKLKIAAVDSLHGRAKARVQRGASPLPDGATLLVLRLSNPASGLNEMIRVQNEVAVMSLIREALAPLNPCLVPALYGWASGKQGWTLCECLVGDPLGDKFEALDDKAKRIIIAQIALIFKSIRQFRLPSSVQGYGGLGFAEDGSIVTGPTVIAGGGPCDTHSALYAEYLATQRGLSEKCDIVQGWIGTDIPARIEKLAREKFTGSCEWEQHLRPTLVHADFDIHNMLFNPKTLQITGLLDYDLGHIGSQADEYMYSLSSLGFLVLPPIKDNEDLRLQREFLLHGIEHERLINRPQTIINWKVALMVDEEFSKAGVERPRDIQAMEEIATRYWVTQNVSPPIFSLERSRKYSLDKLQQMKVGEQRELENGLEALGY
ncbi:hypothetical protein HIM_10432 [Hirsutella minnesotensis 3608]|uniref:Aminoglycoside phosphotransferase domain-containing protein n=1 Tax=Hirsutella minnesotensis 3608 TaxID=1043627 RepID=A0A0F7ZX63_9HYPO|nr:hypothetical protein HIM_10432 [Hirsutella minnesotensis 3608]